MKLQKNKCRDKSLCGIYEEMMDVTNVMELKLTEGTRFETLVLCFHGQVTIKCNTKALDSQK